MYDPVTGRLRDLMQHPGILISRMLPRPPPRVIIRLFYTQHLICESRKQVHVSGYILIPNDVSVPCCLLLFCPYGLPHVYFTDEGQFYFGSTSFHSAVINWLRAACCTQFFFFFVRYVKVGGRAACQTIIHSFILSQNIY